MVLPFIRLLVHHIVVLYLNESTCHQTVLSSAKGIIVVFSAHYCYKIPRETQAGALNTRGGKILQFPTKITSYLQNGTR